MKQRALAVLSTVSIILATVSLLLWTRGVNLRLQWDTYDQIHWHDTPDFSTLDRSFVQFSFGIRHSEWVWNLEWWQIIAAFLALPAIRIARDINGRRAVKSTNPIARSQVSKGARVKRGIYFALVSVSLLFALALLPALWFSHQTGSTRWWQSRESDGEIGLIDGCFGAFGHAAKNQNAA